MCPYWHEPLSEYLTSEMTLEPGLLGLLDKTRGEIEKVFDETQTRLAEQKSWAASDTAQARQAHFVALAHNLLLLRAGWHEAPGVENVAENQRRDQRQEQQKSALQKTGGTVPVIHTLRRRFTPATFKLIRWRRVYWHRPTPLDQALLHLRSLDAKL